MTTKKQLLYELVEALGDVNLAEDYNRVDMTQNSQRELIKAVKAIGTLLKGVLTLLPDGEITYRYNRFSMESEEEEAK